MKPAYTRLKVPTSVLQTVEVGQERLCKRRNGGIHYMQLLDVPPDLCYFTKTDSFAEGLGLLEHTARKSTYLLSQNILPTRQSGVENRDKVNCQSRIL